MGYCSKRRHICSGMLRSSSQGMANESLVAVESTDSSESGEKRTRNARPFARESGVCPGDSPALCLLLDEGGMRMNLYFLPK